MKNHQQDDSASRRDQHGRKAEVILVGHAEPEIRDQDTPGYARAQDAYNDIEQDTFSLSHQRTAHPTDDSSIEEPHNEVYQIIFSGVNG